MTIVNFSRTPKDKSYNMKSLHCIIPCLSFQRRVWFEGRWGSRKVALVAEYVHPERRLTPLSFSFTSRACCAFRSVGKSRTDVVAHHRGGYLKKCQYNFTDTGKQSGIGLDKRCTKHVKDAKLGGFSHSQKRMM